MQVRGIESYEPPTFGQAVRRWLVYGVLGLLAVGVVNVVWCLFDRPWRQCWHDKAARTFVAQGRETGAGFRRTPLGTPRLPRTASVPLRGLARAVHYRHEHRSAAARSAARGRPVPQEAVRASAERFSLRRLARRRPVILPTARARRPAARVPTARRRPRSVAAGAVRTAGRLPPVAARRTAAPRHRRPTPTGAGTAVSTRWPECRRSPTTASGSWPASSTS